MLTDVTFKARNGESGAKCASHNRLKLTLFHCVGSIVSGSASEERTFPGSVSRKKWPPFKTLPPMLGKFADTGEKSRKSKLGVCETRGPPPLKVPDSPPLKDMNDVPTCGKIAEPNPGATLPLNGVSETETVKVQVSPTLTMPPMLSAWFTVPSNVYVTTAWAEEIVPMRQVVIANQTLERLEPVFMISSVEFR